MNRQLFHLGLIVLSVFLVQTVTAQTPNVPKIVKVETGYMHTCLLFETGSIKCLGALTEKILGVDNKDIVDISTGYYQACVRYKNGSFKCFNRNAMIPMNVKAVDMQLSGYALCYLADTGAVSCTGGVINGSVNLVTPDEATQSKLFVAANFVCAQTPGSLKCRTAAGATTLNFGKDKKIQQVVAGSAHLCVLLSDNTVRCWGDNGQGQMGTALTRQVTFEQEGALVDLESDLKFKLYAKDYQMCAIFDLTGTAKCWGFNSFGQLGMGDRRNRGNAMGETPSTFPYLNLGSLLRVNMLSMSYSHACAVMANNALKCWGDNSSGQLGLPNRNMYGDEPGEMGDRLPFVDVAKILTQP